MISIIGSFLDESYGNIESAKSYGMIRALSYILEKGTTGDDLMQLANQV